MDFDKLKKAAKETFRIMTGKDDEELFDDDEEITGNDAETEPESDFDYAPEPFDTADEESDADAATSDDNSVERTQRIDLKSVLQMFKSNGSDDNRQTSDTSKKDIIDSIYYLINDKQKQTLQSRAIPIYLLCNKVCVIIIEGINCG